MADRLGFMYVAVRPCGKLSAAAWDDPGHAKSIAQSVASWIKRGDTVSRIERKEGDKQPEWSCYSDEPCACRESKKNA